MADPNILERLRFMKLQQINTQGIIVKHDFENIKTLIERNLISATEPGVNTVVTVDFLNDTAKMRVLEPSECLCVSGIPILTIITKYFTFGHEKYNMTEWFKLTYKIDHFEVIDGAVYAIW